MGRKRKLKEEEEDDNNGPQEIDLPPAHLQVGHLRKEEKRLIVILEGSQLETAKVSKNFQSKIRHEKENPPPIVIDFNTIVTVNYRLNKNLNF